MGSQAALPRIPRSRGVWKEIPGDVAGVVAREWPGAALFFVINVAVVRPPETRNVKLLVGWWWPVHQAPCLSTERTVPGAALRGELAPSRSERGSHRGGSYEVATHRL